MTWKLKRTRQCKKCPWRVETNPHTIPNGYSEEKHRNLKSTIADVENPFHRTNAMSCHEHSPEDETHCIGWLMNQLGVGNNIALRMSMVGCENTKAITLDGEQHLRFEDTLPKGQSHD